MLKLDIDGFTHIPRLVLQRILYAMPRPFFLRLSSSRKGLHIVVPLCSEWDWRRFAYDDPMRVSLDLQRLHKHLAVKNLLWDTKNGKHAGHWRAIESELNIESFLDVIETQFIYSKHYNECLWQNEQ